mmetsp:Transcript_19954/g.18956  ORF Transcript_19954/g.18956 Transcript_19954/m.18956 type:complete len:195 (-) Transcript_19954:724-1308(-)|eukprot:CAMPEP_0170560450 /NCGR_PEP_ID=MMETSP0211-20121228/48970_1 /TAXON_ID=311385 /ORGANISM="Pseudokeronopsis sp., Strain OXSARD2" /LENGTH=194 /DNA_ID=CAMNT_0010874643 /DNA_START=750 /DNA_END=1334 /DNA_ORIENTATION=-
MNEYERIFSKVETSDKLDRLNKILEDYKGFSKKKKIKYATIGKKNLLKVINHFYHEKFSSTKHKTLLLEIISDLTKIKYGNDTITDKKIFRLFSSAVFHAPNCKRVAMFAKFLQLGKRNLSNEILVFYLQGIFLLKNKNMDNNFIRANQKNDDECVTLQRAHDSFKELFEGIIPIEVFSTLRKKVEMLIYKEEN